MPRQVIGVCDKGKKTKEETDGTRRVVGRRLETGNQDSLVDLDLDVQSYLELDSEASHLKPPIYGVRSSVMG